MSLTLQVVLVVASIGFFLAVVRLVVQGKLQLKYSLLWMLLSVGVLACAIFPGLPSAISHLLGMGLTSNFVFMVGFLFLIGMCLSLSVIVSWQARDIRSLVQQVALLHKELEERDMSKHEV